MLERHASWLHAPQCLWESFVRRSDGRPEIGFGGRGQLGVRLSARCLAADQHAAFSPVLRSAPALLTRALASLTDAAGDVQIDGFYDDVRGLGRRRRLGRRADRRAWRASSARPERPATGRA